MSNVAPIGGSNLNPEAIKASIERSAPTDDAKAEKVGQQFEAVLLRQYLGDALKPMFKGYLDEGGSMHGTYRYFITDVLAENMSSQGAFGMGTQLSSQIKGQDARAAETSDASKAPKTELSSDIRSFRSLSKTNGITNAK